MTDGRICINIVDSQIKRDLKDINLVIELHRQVLLE